MFPTNDGGLSVAGVLKWIAIITGVVCLTKAYQGIVGQKGATGSFRNVGDALTGEAATSWGWQNLGLAVLCFVVAWALWFFWQRNED